jgi:hypothetical protein
VPRAARMVALAIRFDQTNLSAWAAFHVRT